VSEFSLIKQYCKNVGINQPETILGVGDDAAIVQIPHGKELVISVDSLVENVHFFKETAAALIAYKLVSVNLSDMAAMGATPKWITLALTLPNNNESWLSDFSKSLNSICNNYQVQLIGGDTCRGPLVLSLQVMGLVDMGRALSRSNAKVGDDVYVSGSVGDASLALACVQGKVSLSKSDKNSLRSALDSPLAQVELGQNLLGVANSCIDVSDGLVGDLSHIAEQSGVTLSLDVETLPLSNIYSEYLIVGGTLNYALSGGEDYQLAFTAPIRYREKIAKLSEKLNVRITKIGSVLKEVDQKVILHNHGKLFTLSDDVGYQHFSE